MSKPKITFNYQTTPIHAVKKTTTDLVEDPLASSPNPSKTLAQPSPDLVDMLKGENEIKVPQEPQNPEKAQNFKAPQQKEKPKYTFAVVPQQPAPKKTVTCSFFSSLFESCKQAPQRAYSIQQ